MIASSYASLDTSANRELATALRMLCKEESESAGRGPIQLSSAAEVEAPGENLTPAMRQWVASHIAGLRRLAWGGLEGQARSIRVEDIDGIVMEIEQDRIERAKEQRRANAVETFTRKHKALVETVA